MAIAIDITDEGVKKRLLIERAFGRLGIAGYEFGRTPEEISTGLELLNGLMAEWPFNEIASYEQPDYGTGSADEASGVTIKDVPAVVAKLALLLAPEFGVTLSPEARQSMASSIRSIQSRYASIPAMPRRNEPRGAGATRYGSGVDTFLNEGRSTEEREAAEAAAQAPDPGDLAGLL